MLKWISKIFPLSPTSVREENNIVQSIAKAKIYTENLYLKLIQIKILLKKNWLKS